MALPSNVDAALKRVLGFRWKSHGYGTFTCTSCGAKKQVNYGDHDQPTTETKEPCSRSCPWQIVEEWHDSMDVEC